MARVWVLSAAMILTVPSLCAAADDPLAPARAGMVECFKPDAAHKTCAEIDVYTFDAQGGIRNRQEVMLVPKPLVVATADSAVTVHDGAVCGTLDKQDYDNAAITVDGNPAPGDVATNIRNLLSDSAKADLGKESCIALVPQGDGFATRMTIGGVEKPDQASTALWVKPEEGYTLGGS